MFGIWYIQNLDYYVRIENQIMLFYKYLMIWEINYHVNVKNEGKRHMNSLIQIMLYVFMPRKMTGVGITPKY